MSKIKIFPISILILMMTFPNNTTALTEGPEDVNGIFRVLAAHNFHPLYDENAMTYDRNLNKAGIANMNNEDWKTRLLAVRNLVRAKTQGYDIIAGLDHPSPHVRQVTAKALGITRSTDKMDQLAQIAREDSVAMVRSQAVIALGQMEAKEKLSLLKVIFEKDPSRDVKHQCELAIDQIEKEAGATDKLLQAFLDLDETSFGQVSTGDMAPDFSLEDTNGNKWRLSDFKGKKNVVLIWVFADWCPVCHGEFHDLIEMQDEFREQDTEVVTIEIHDTYRGRVMVGKELEPDYWFAKEPFQEAYTSQIKWRHLLDRAGSVGAMYGTDPLAFAVHAEYINRPATFIIDKAGRVKFSYIGTFWGDRPTIEETMEMIKTENYSFRHPQRLRQSVK